MSYSCTLTKIIYFFKKQLHFDFESVLVCYFDIDLGMSSLSNKWEPIFLVVTKILHKIRATTFTEKLRKITRDGERLGMSNAAFN